MMRTLDEALERAYLIGREHGEAAASWYFDGNTELATYVRVLHGIEEGDPGVLDSFPYPDLSGQWADGYTPTQLLDDVGGNAGDASFHDGLVSDLCDQYELGFNDAVQESIERAARYQVEHDLEVRS